MQVAAQIGMSFDFVNVHCVHLSNETIFMHDGFDREMRQSGSKSAF